MAFCGDSEIHLTKTGFIDTKDSLFDWMKKNNINWRVYHDSLSFFLFYREMWPFVFSDRFKPYEDLRPDMVNEPKSDTPQLIIVEPSYADAPHIGSDQPNDNHAPLAIGWGEKLLSQTYEAVISNNEKWKETVMIVYYDEHGGFYDHIPPPLVAYKTTSTPPYSFTSLGPRVPALIISPFVEKGSVCHELMDHTSVLQFLTEVFNSGKPYSDTVEARKNGNPSIKSVCITLTKEYTEAPPFPPQDSFKPLGTIATNTKTPPQGAMGQAFEAIALQAIQEDPQKVMDKFPDLHQWKMAKDSARNDLPA